MRSICLALSSALVLQAVPLLACARHADPCWWRSGSCRDRFTGTRKARLVHLNYTVRCAPSNRSACRHGHEHEARQLFPSPNPGNYMVEVLNPAEACRRSASIPVAAVHHDRHSFDDSAAIAGRQPWRAAGINRRSSHWCSRRRHCRRGGRLQERRQPSR
jgi:hypothetical protein